MRINHRDLQIALLASTLAVSLMTGCAQHTPSIAHVHIGHAITGAHDTPDKDGYFIVARNKADLALKFAEKTKGETDLNDLKYDIESAVRASDHEDDFGVKQAISEAANHINFAAMSADSSDNLKETSEVFSRNIAAVLDRCELIALLGKDVKMTASREEGDVFAQEITLLAYANVYGDDSNGDGVLGSVPEEYGLVQLQQELDALVERKDPTYETVDRWYLFNLIRMPSGEWAYRKWFDGGGSGGYQ